MNFNETIDLLWLAGGLYGLAFLAGFLKTFRVNWSPLQEAPLAGIIIGFIFHTRALYLRGLEVHGCPLGNGMERIQFILWSLILAFLILRIIWRLDLLGSFCAGLAFVVGWLTMILPEIDSEYWLAPNYRKLFSNPWIELHASIAIFSYGLFSLLAVVSLMYLIQRKALLSRKFDKLGSYLPPIQDLEVASWRLLSVGVLFLTISILVGGMHWSRHPEFVSVSKLAITLFLWVSYTCVFFLHASKRLYGSKFAKISIFLLILAIASLALVNSKKTSETSAPAQNNVENQST